jgi:anaerobic magnesium-protoporphyrin IX monomethyl ester cyclase
MDLAKKINKDTLTVVGGQHFTVTAEESLKHFPEIDIIVRGEGEETLTEIVANTKKKISFKKIEGISFRIKNQIFHNPCRALIEDINTLPYPGYHLVKDLMHKYHFTAMVGRDYPYALIEGSRGCSHKCTFCTQWKYWGERWRLKTAERIADEMEYCFNNYGSRFIWLTDDNFGFGTRASRIADEINKRGMGEELLWFTQARCDDVLNNKEILPKLRKSGLRWILLGVENSKINTGNF